MTNNTSTFEKKGAHIVVVVAIILFLLHLFLLPSIRLNFTRIYANYHNNRKYIKTVDTRAR